MVKPELQLVGGTVEKALDIEARQNACAKEFEALMQKYRCVCIADPKLAPLTLPSGQIVFALSAQVIFQAMP